MRGVSKDGCEFRSVAIVRDALHAAKFTQAAPAMAALPHHEVGIGNYFRPAASIVLVR